MINLDKFKLGQAGMLFGLLAFYPPAHALELGFEAISSVEFSDNIFASNAGLEEEGQIGFGQIGVYGEQRGRVVQGAFSGELETQKRLNDDDDNFDALTRFIGAVNIAVTPKTISWYFGDILGGVRTDNGIQSIADDDAPRRNVFVTGPTIEYDLGAFSRVNSRLLYVNQSDEDGELASLYNFSAGWETDTERGSTWGINISDIFTENPDDSVETDFNRLSGTLFWQRERGRNSIYAGVGATAYTTDADDVTGLNAAFTFIRQLDAQQSLSVSLSRDLQDQTLSTIESLIEDGSGEQPEANGFFDETRLELGYSMKTSVSSIDTGVGISFSDFQFLADASAADANLEDQSQPFAFAVWTQRITPRLRSEFSMNYEQLDFDNRVDETRSVLLDAAVFYQLSRSFSVEVGFEHDTSTGIRTRFDNGIGTEEDIDVTETRGRLGLRWAPLSRANKDLIVDLKSLLQ